LYLTNHPLLRSSCIVLCAVGMLVACTKAVVPVKPVPTVISASLSAAERVNVDARDRSTPVVIRLYLLKSTAVFDAADFFSLFERDQQTLGDTLVAHEEWVLKPGQVLKLDPREVDGVKALGVFAAFREVDRAAWRATVPVVNGRTNEVAVRLEGNRVVLSATLSAVRPATK